MAHSSLLTPSISTSGRMHGLDLARYVALVGMVIVNFSLALGVENLATPLHRLVEQLEGRAAATFVVLAGVGFALAFGNRPGSTRSILKRACFLFGLGLLNMLIFEADILHFYAAYFALGTLVLMLSTQWLLIFTMALPLVFVGLTILFDYDAGWNWISLTYTELWSPAGFVRNLLFNGWHPVVPWFAFFTFGMALARLPLRKRRTHVQLILSGLGLVVGSILLSHITANLLGPLSGLKPIPPGPFFVMGGCGAAITVIGLCLLAAEQACLSKSVQLLAPAGRQTLTLYFAHILIGMGTLEIAGLLGSGTVETAFWAALLFMGVATLYAALWSLRFNYGPLEWLMRRLAH